MNPGDWSGVVILRGAGAPARARAWVDPADRPTLCFDPGLDPAVFVPLPWGAGRRLLDAATELVGADAVRAATAGVRGRLSVALPALVADLDERERAERGQHHAIGRYPFAGPILHDAVAAAWAEVLGDLFGARGVNIVVPSPALVEPESWGIFPALLRRMPRACLVFAQAFPAALEGVRGRVAEIARRQLTRLEALRGAPVRIIHVEEDAPAPPRAGMDALSPLDTRADDDAARRLSGPLSAAAVPEIAAAVRRAFDASSFASAAIFAEPLLARPDPFPGRDEIELLATIARHTLAVSEPRLSPADPLFQDIEAGYRRALGGLVDPGDRSHAHYHLSILTGGRGDGREPESHAADALREARAVEAPRRALYEGFALNVIALAHYRRRRIEEAIAASQSALRVFEAGLLSPALPTIELQVARFKVTNNLARLFDMRGDRAESRRLFLACDDLRLSIPWRRPFFNWFVLAVFLDSLSSSAEHLERSMEESLRRWEEDEVATFSNFAGLLRYMLGHPREALANFQRAHDVWSIFRVSALDIFNLRVNCAVSAYRAGLLDEAERWLGRVSELVPEIDPSLGADVDLMGASLAVSRGDLAGARRTAERISAAMDDLGDDTGARARRHRALGDVYLDIGDRPSARLHFRAARDFFMMDPEPGGVLFDADVFGALAGMIESGDDDPAILAEAVRRAASALTETNAWWDLPRLLRGLARRAAGGGADINPPLVRRLSEMASQRRDCREPVAAILAAYRPLQRVIAP